MRSDEMIQKVVAAAAVLILSLEVDAQSCKEPLVAQRLLADDVRYASPFYVTALPRNSETEQMDNVCYSYFENGDNFFHIMSITYKNGSNTFYTYTKGDLSNRLGLAVGSGILDSQCVFHDYTLLPVCNSTVFILYRCFIEGDCNKNIDIGVTPGVDVRVALAANPIVSQECREDIQASLRNTSTLAGNDYVILPQLLAPQCVTRYNNTDSVGKNRAVGSKQVTDDELVQRFGFSDDQGTVQTNTVTQPPQPQIPPQPQYQQQPQYQPVQSTYQGAKPVPSTKTSFNPYGTTVKSNVARQGYTPAPAWATNGNVNYWRQAQGMESHHHHGGNPNVVYHIHSWQPQWQNPQMPNGCCKCN